MLTAEQVQAKIASMSDAEILASIHDWRRVHARPEQLAPPGDWRTWLFLAGRGAGKTKSGAEWVREKVKESYRRIALIAPTAADARDVMVEGESGLMSVCWSGDHMNDGSLLGRPTYEPSKRRVSWANGALVTLYSAEEPDRLRGPQHDTMWADEVASWYDPQATWDMAMFGLRLGKNPQVMVSTTPRPIPLIRELLKAKTTVVTRATTYDNKRNLAGAFMDQIIGKYEGTRLGRQELMAELLEESDQALWNRSDIERARLKGDLPQMRRIVVAIDPAVTAKADSNLTGIVVAGIGDDGLGYVLADKSSRYTPNAWATTAVNAFRDYKADRIVAEGNQGGDLVRHTLENVDSNIPIKIVWASRGKQARAEPIAALYEQGRVRHASAFAELEDQMCTWEPLGDEPSPDRLDALVWALTALMVNQGQPGGVGTYAMQVD